MTYFYKRGCRFKETSWSNSLLTSLLASLLPVTSFTCILFCYQKGRQNIKFFIICWFFNRRATISSWGFERRFMIYFFGDDIVYRGWREGQVHWCYICSVRHSSLYFHVTSVSLFVKPPALTPNKQTQYNKAEDKNRIPLHKKNQNKSVQARWKRIMMFVANLMQSLGIHPANREESEE